MQTELDLTETYVGVAGAQHIAHALSENTVILSQCRLSQRPRVILFSPTDTQTSARSCQ